MNKAIVIGKELSYADIACEKFQNCEVYNFMLRREELYSGSLYNCLYNIENYNFVGMVIMEMDIIMDMDTAMGMAMDMGIDTIIRQGLNSRWLWTTLCICSWTSPWT